MQMVWGHLQSIAAAHHVCWGQVPSWVPGADAVVEPMTTYGLVDPRTGCLRYVGKTSKLDQRLYWHIADSKRYSHRCAQWVKGLVKLGLLPILVVLEDGDQEVFWIASLRAAGASLLNVSDGGDCVTWTPEVRAKASASAKARGGPGPRYWAGKKQPPEMVAKRTEARRGYRPSEATKQKMRESAKARHRV